MTLTAHDPAPFLAPPGVLHTPGGVGQTLNRVGQSVGQVLGKIRRNPLTARVSAAQLVRNPLGSVGQALPKRWAGRWASHV